MRRRLSTLLVIVASVVTLAHGVVPHCGHRREKACGVSSEACTHNAPGAKVYCYMHGHRHPASRDADECRIMESAAAALIHLEKQHGLRTMQLLCRWQVDSGCLPAPAAPTGGDPAVRPLPYLLANPGYEGDAAMGCETLRAPPTRR